jgi:hypothetical protein
MKRVCIHQPDFCPYIGFFDRLLVCDIFVVLDDVQFIRRGWQHRDKIKTPRGAEWITLSVEKGEYSQVISDTRLLNGTAWRMDCLNLLQENYRKARFFEEYFPSIRSLFLIEENNLAKFNLRFLRWLLEIFEIQIEISLSSALDIEEKSTKRLINIVEKVGGTHYLTGTGSRDYLDEDLFRRSGLSLEWQNFQHPQYDQLYGDFIPYLSVLDLVFNCGPESKDIVRQGQQK